MPTAVVITTIQPPTSGVRAIARQSQAADSKLFVVGDRKSPAPWQCNGADYLSFDAQRDLPFASASVTPADSYTRKNLGYLLAAIAGVDFIRETDDDNSPHPSFFQPVPKSTSAREALPLNGWVNPYAYFTDRHVWPRGFPLGRVASASSFGPQVSTVRPVADLCILQAVADGDPDVDAVYRLTAQDSSDIAFERACPLVIPHGAWTPFNSQATTWPRRLLPLMYLPSTCSFRMTDIWRSFVAQRLLPGLGAELVFTSSTVFQERNAHDLMRDFQDEVEGYLGYERFVEILRSTRIVGKPSALLDDLKTIYAALVSEGFLTEMEFPILEAWISDMQALGH
jgi:hypothetical protein